MAGAYFDSCLLVKLYIDEPGSARVRALANDADLIVSSSLARAEFASALHRQLRENALSPDVMENVLNQFSEDRDFGKLRFLPITDVILKGVERTFPELPTNLPLRAADAIHLATAAEAGFREIHSNDMRLLKAAPRFRLKGVDPTR